MSKKAPKEILQQPTAPETQSASNLEAYAAQRNWEYVEHCIGPRYSSCRISNFSSVTSRHGNLAKEAAEFVDRIPAACAAGQGLIIFGPKGTGKDHLAIAMLRAAALKHLKKVQWTDGQALLAASRELIRAEMSEHEFTKPMILADILLISDPVSYHSVLTEWQASLVWRIVESRYRAMRPTWITVNATDGEDLSVRLGSSIVDRLKDGATVFSTVGLETYRKALVVKNGE